MEKLDSYPERCPKCGAPGTDFALSREEPGRLGRFFQGLAYALIPVMIVWLLFRIGTGAFSVGAGSGLGYGIAGIIASPSLLVYLLAQLMPRVRGCSCRSCGWYAEVTVRWW